MMRLSTEGRTRLKRLEGFRDKAYQPVPNDRLTIGYGFTKGVRPGDTITLAEADARLIEELRPYEQAVWDGCTLRPNQNQFDAMVLLCFNIGTGGFARSSVLRLHNLGDRAGAAQAFGLWNKSSGTVYAGLVRRRAEESDLYLTPAVGHTAPQPIPDAPAAPPAPTPPAIPTPSTGLVHWLRLLIEFLTRKRN